MSQFWSICTFGSQWTPKTCKSLDSICTNLWEKWDTSDMSVSHSENESWNKKGVRYCGKWIMLWKDLVIVTSHHERNHWLAMLISRTWECKSLVTNVLCCPGSLHLERWIQVLKISHLSNCFFPPRNCKLWNIRTLKYSVKKCCIQVNEEQKILFHSHRSENQD